jgi:hypothetical protein
MVAGGKARWVGRPWQQLQGHEGPGRRGREERGGRGCEWYEKDEKD